MKKITLLLSAVFLTSLFSTEAWSKSFYKSKLKMKLTYSNAYTKTKTLGRASATVVMSDDNGSSGASFCELKTKKRTYKCVANYYASSNYTIILTASDLKTILEDEFKIEGSRVSQMQLDNSMQFRRHYSRYYGTEKTMTIQIHTDSEVESYHLIAKAGKARKQ